MLALRGVRERIGIMVEFGIPVPEPKRSIAVRRTGPLGGPLNSALRAIARRVAG